MILRCHYHLVQVLGIQRLKSVLNVHGWVMKMIFYNTQKSNNNSGLTFLSDSAKHPYAARSSCKPHVAARKRLRAAGI
jgi:hypothetical protein